MILNFELGFAETVRVFVATVLRLVAAISPEETETVRIHYPGSHKGGLGRHIAFVMTRTGGTEDT